MGISACIGIAFFFSFITFQSLTLAAELPASPANFYYDELDILNDETKLLIEEQNNFYKSKANSPQIVVATINSTDDETIDSYANHLFNTWKIGDLQKNNGILILYALNGGVRNVRIEVGYGLEDVITNSVAENILEKASNHLKSSNEDSINDGIQFSFKAAATLINQKYEYVTSENMAYSDVLASITDDNDVDFSVYVILFVIGATPFVAYLYYSRIKPRQPEGTAWFWNRGYDGYHDDGHHSSRSHFFGGGGGSSGDGGGFSGGGGSSGGGGASI